MLSSHQMHRIGEDRTDRLDIVPAQLRVLVTVRPKIPLTLALRRDLWRRSAIEPLIAYMKTDRRLARCP